MNTQRSRSSQLTLMLGALYLLTLIFITSAQAQFVNLNPISLDEPTLEECQDPTFIEDANWLVAGMCRNILGQEAARKFDAALREGRVQSTHVPALVNGEVVPVALSSAKILPAESLRSTLNNFTLPAWFGYELNGNSVYSCDEYIYQRYYHYHKYQQEILKTRTARDGFEATFDPDGQGNIGHRYLSAYPTSRTAIKFFSGVSLESDQVFDPIMPLYGDLLADLGVYVQPLPKNDFFALTDSELQMVRWLDRDLAQKITLGRSYYRVRIGGRRSAHLASQELTGWELHQRFNERLSQIPDVELEVIAGRRSAMRNLIQQRRSLIHEGVYQYSSRVMAINCQLITLLRQADEEGCLDINPDLDPSQGQYDYNRCDWAPSDLDLHIRHHMDHKIAYQRQLCETYFPTGDVSQGYTYRLSNGYQRRTTVNPLKSSNYLRFYLSRMKTQTEYYLSQFDTSGADADRNLPYWGRSYGDNWLWGAREWVAAEVEYHAEWAMSEGQAREVCDINPQFDVGGQANAYLFDQRYKVLNARASFDLRRARRKVDLEIFDHDYLVYDWEREGSSEPRRIDYDFTRADHGEFSEDVEYCQEFLIVAVPVVLCAELAGRVGFAFELSARVDEEQNGECNPEAEVKLSGRPFASVDALGSGGVGVSGLGGGIYASVNLLEMQVPTQVNASLRMLGDASNVEINVSADSKLTLASLKGEIGGYVEFPRICVPFTDKCIGGRVSEEFFTWKRAIDAEFDLFEFDWSIDLNTWGLICDIPEVDCEG